MNAWCLLRELGAQRRRLLGSLNGSGSDSCQEYWLLECLKRNSKSEPGRRYQFKNITSARQFQDSLPLCQYEDIAPSIDAMARGEKDVLFSGKPLMFERTSGSRGASKLIPYTEHSLFDFQSALLPWIADLIDENDLETGKAYWSISPATRVPSHTMGGIPLGVSDAQYLGNEAVVPFSLLSAVPFSVGEIPSIEEWKTATLCYLLQANDLALISVWSPTFFQLLLDGMHENFPRLEQLLSYGGTVATEKFAADRDALARLRNYVNQGRRGDCSVLWPGLRLVSCWGDASSESYFSELEQQCPQAHFQRKGLLSTECVVTVPDKNDDNRLCLHSAFYEFLDASGNPMLAGDLKRGESYEVIVTTAGGLYRYLTGDMVLCIDTSVERQGPALRFLGRAGITSDLVGEKLTEAFVSQCFAGVNGFCVLTPRPDKRPGYLLLVERNTPASVVGYIERKLQENPHYAYAERIGQLAPLERYFLDNPLDRYIAWSTRIDRKLGDIKPSCLRPEPDFASYMGVTS